MRLAPPLFGRAAFARVPDEEILKRVDPDDRDGDGVRGRANRTAQGIGRYGWKAAKSVEDQVAHAFAFDIGLSSPKQPLPYGDCTKFETACLAAANGESPLFDGREISGMMLGLVASYLETLRRATRGVRSGAPALFARPAAQPVTCRASRRATERPFPHLPISSFTIWEQHSTTVSASRG